MKKSTLLDIRKFEPGQTITGFFAVRKKEIRTKKDGEPYLFLELGNPTGRIPATLWENPENVDQTIQSASLVKIQAKVIEYHDHLQLSLDKVRPVQKSDNVSPHDFVPRSTGDLKEFWNEFDALISSIKENSLKKLALRIFANKTFRKRFEETPGGKLWHHAYIGGLLEHTLNVTKLCDRAAQNYPDEVNRDLLVTAALLHDIGKIESYEMDQGFIEYSDTGRLWGHIVIGAQNVRILIEQLNHDSPFPEELKTTLIHLILSHQGTLEHGSPAPPMTREAFILYYMDELDSKLNAFKHVEERDHQPGHRWSRYVPVMDRFFYLGDEKKPAGF